MSRNIYLTMIAYLIVFVFLYFQSDGDYCMLLALPCGRDHVDVMQQTKALSTGFIQYLQQKQAAGIVNVPDPDTKQVGWISL